MAKENKKITSSSEDLFVYTVSSVTILILVTLFFEIVFGIIFWVRDTATLIHVPSTKDAAYVYYEYESKADHLNEDGFSTTKPMKKLDGIFRIALIGGGVAENLGNSLNEQGILILENELNKVLQTNVIEVVNAALTGYVVEQEFIKTQLVILKKYNPDLIIRLNGADDLQSFFLNRFEKTITSFPPQNYRQFNIIEQGKRNKSFIARFRPLLRNNLRAWNVFKRLLGGENYNSPMNLDENQTSLVANEYYSLVDDLRDFVKAKGIDYYGFLQPIRFYDNKNSDLVANKLENARGLDVQTNKTLVSLYNKFEKKYLEDEDLFSLTNVLDDNLYVYTDNFQMTPEGHKLLSKEIAQILKDKIQKNKKFIEHKHKRE